MDVDPINAEVIAQYDDVDVDAWAAWDPRVTSVAKQLLNPAIFRLLGPLQGRRVLDAGCGQGYLCRLMADRGAAVTGLEPAKQPLAYARRVEEQRRQGITYLQRDLSRPGDVAGAPFDAVVANMVLLDIAAWEQALDSCLRMLRPGGLLVFSVLHPCWPPTAMATWAEHERVEMTEYLQPYEITGGTSTNFIRAFSLYLNHALRQGARLVEICEPAPPPGAVELPDIAWHIPNYLVMALMTLG